MHKFMYSDVILPVPLQQLFTYHIPNELADRIAPGCRVIVQFGSRKFYTGLVKTIHDRKPEYETKPIETLLDETPIVFQEHFKFWDWISNYYMCNEGDILKAALPSGLKLESQTLLTANPEADLEITLGPNEQAVFQIISEEKNTTISQLNNRSRKASSVYPVVQSLLRKGLITIEEQITESYKPKTESHVSIDRSLEDEAQLEVALNSLKRAAKQHQMLVDLLNELDWFGTERIPSISKKTFLTRTKGSESTLKTLCDKGFATIVQIETDRISISEDEGTHQFSLNALQQKAFDEIHSHFTTRKTVLLHGVTASGKTEIYIKLIEEQLAAGKQVLFLMPEIALTSQMITRLTRSFGSKAGVYHSKFNDSERVEIWNKVLEFDPANHIESQFQLILGARSAIFLPFKNLGLIIVDEEHENSYKQFDPAPRYNARDAAVVLASLYSASILMGTATPSFESYFNAQSGKYGYVAINKRFHDVEMPHIEVADMKEAYHKKQMRSYFTPKLFQAIEQALEKKKQVILFQNRRGFASFLQCRNCGDIPRCKQCDVSLTYHKFSNRLQCHYCGYSIQMPGHCLACHSTDVQTRGVGTEKLEDELKILFPDTQIGRLDLDSTRNKHGFEKIIGQFESGNIDILVGTQMITKGLDFANVEVVGIINADNMLNFPDFRSYERAYQLMAQVSGRAGRKNDRGKVIIQTYQAEHPIIDCVVHNDYHRMFTQYIDERQFFRYPPWFRLINITLKHKNNERAVLAARQLTAQLKLAFGERVLGPEYPLIGRMQLLYLQVVRLKLERQISLPEAKKSIMQAIEQVQQLEHNRSVQINIDVDPQ